MALWVAQAHVNQALRHLAQVEEEERVARMVILRWCDLDCGAEKSENGRALNGGYYDDDF